MFKRILLETVYPLVSSPHLPPSVWGDDKLEEVSFPVIPDLQDSAAVWFMSNLGEICFYSVSQISNSLGVVL